MKPDAGSRLGVPRLGGTCTRCGRWTIYGFAASDRAQPYATCQRCDPEAYDLTMIRSELEVAQRV